MRLGGPVFNPNPNLIIHDRTILATTTTCVDMQVCGYMNLHHFWFDKQPRCDFPPVSNEYVVSKIHGNWQIRGYQGDTVNGMSSTVGSQILWGGSGYTQQRLPLDE